MSEPLYCDDCGHEEGPHEDLVSVSRLPVPVASANAGESAVLCVGCFDEMLTRHRVQARELVDRAREVGILREGGQTGYGQQMEVRTTFGSGVEFVLTDEGRIEGAWATIDGRDLPEDEALNRIERAVKAREGE